MKTYETKLRVIFIDCFMDQDEDLKAEETSDAFVNWRLTLIDSESGINELRVEIDQVRLFYSIDKKPMNFDFSPEKINIEIDFDSLQLKDIKPKFLYVKKDKKTDALNLTVVF